MSEPVEKKHHPLNLTAWIAIILWVISSVFQVGAIYATNMSKAYVDERTESLRMELKEDLREINQKLDRLIEKKNGGN